MYAIVKEPGKRAELRNVATTPAALGALVGGEYESINFDGMHTLLCNVGGGRNGDGLVPNIYLDRLGRLFGTVVVVSTAGQGVFVDMPLREQAGVADLLDMRSL